MMVFDWEIFYNLLEIKIGCSIIMRDNFVTLLKQIINDAIFSNCLQTLAK